MPQHTHLVNLDALIKREDFESGPKAVGEVGEEITFNATQLKQGEFFYSCLRKPTFQRETSNWSPNMIVEFIRSFLDGELIPSVILWRSKQTNHVFIVDGSHRISALIAWINDDYGDGEISRQFWGPVPPKQAALHRKTQELVNETIGTYKSLCSPSQSQSQGALSELSASRAFRASARQTPTQKVEGDAEICEKSFLTINSNPATIDKNELAIIKARKKPNALATRALMRAGTGYPYWGNLPRAQEITKLAGETYELLFGQIVDIGTRVADVPRAGQPYSAEAFTMLLDMVNIFNEVTPAMWQQSTSKNTTQTTITLPDDLDGNTTLAFIEKVQKVARLAISPETKDGSLGLDQVVYSYGANGKFYPTAFIASLKFAKELTDSERYAFLKIRLPFEDFLVDYKSFIKDIGHSKGSRLRGLAAFTIMYKTIFKALSDGERDIQKIMSLLLGNPDLKLKEPNLKAMKVNRVTRKKFPKSVQAAAAVREALKTHGRCTICGARLPFYSRSQDHKLDGSKGGTGSLNNLQYTHPYCNSVKTKLEAEGWKLIGDN